jgi:hypothetical protein
MSLGLVRSGGSGCDAGAGKPRTHTAGEGLNPAAASSQGARIQTSRSSSAVNHRHRLRVYRLDHRIRRGRQEAVNEVRARHRLGLGTTVALEFGPDAGKGRERPIIV